MTEDNKERDAGVEAEGFSRIVTVAPAWDKRHKDPNKNYGIHGCDLVFTLKGPKGATYFSVFTNWYLPHVSRELWTKRGAGMSEHNPFEPMGCEVGYHSPVPQGEWQTEPSNKSCEYLDGNPCYCDSSATAADPLMAKLIAKGSDAVWAELHRWYEERFPAATPDQANEGPSHVS